jgi:hypothetical protein
MKFKIGDHLQEIGSHRHGIVTHQYAVACNRMLNINYGDSSFRNLWYLIKNDELRLINHWVPESKLELHKQTLREWKLKELGIEKT